MTLYRTFGVGDIRVYRLLCKGQRLLLKPCLQFWSTKLWWKIIDGTYWHEAIDRHSRNGSKPSALVLQKIPKAKRTGSFWVPYCLF
jgi:hypothetical protein